MCPRLPRQVKCLDPRTLENPSSARKLLLGSLSHATLDAAVRGLKASQIKSIGGKQKAAVWMEIQRMGAPFGTPDEADAFVALNFGMHHAGLVCVAQEAA